MEPVKTDVLIIGGGIAGCFAAIQASEMGKSVVLLDKATIRRGGSVGPGMDGIYAGASPIPGTMSLEDAKEKAIASRKELMNPNVIFVVEKECYQRVLDLEKFGVKVREDDGSWKVLRIPERRWASLSYRGVDTKVKIAEAVQKTGTTVIERTMGIDLITHNGSVVGAVALDVRDGKVTTFLSKTTILCTGDSGRQYIEPDGLFQTYHPPTNTGDAESMAYRAGADLANMEYIYMDYTSLRAGGGIIGVMPFDWMGVLVNRKGEQVLKKEQSARRGLIMAKEIAEGRGPLYWDLSKVPEEAFKLMERKMSHEYPITKEWFKQRGLNLRKDLIPVTLTPTAIQGGLVVDEKFKTSIKGLYAAGASTAYIMGLTESAVCGHIAAEEAACYASEIDEPELDVDKAKTVVTQTLAPLKKADGINPKELESAVRSISTDYVGFFKNGEVMEAGLERLLEMKKDFLPSPYAKNPHELMRCLEVRNIFDMVEMHIRASLMRKESRMRRVGLFPHFRVDYPKTDPAWEKLVVVRREDDEMKLFIQEIPEFKEE